MPRKDHMPDCRPAGDSARRISIPSRSTATSPYSPRRSFCSGVPFRSSACTAAHVYESEFHRALFSDPQGGYAGRIHPDDLEQEAKNGVAGMRHVFLRKNPNRDVRHFKLFREYRALVHGAYKRVTEEFQILEMDRAGNVWLVLSIVNLSANQQPPYKVTSQLIDARTGDSFSPLDDLFDREEILTPREREVLQCIAQGRPSKEIADELHISIHTVNTHRQRILAKLGVDNSLEAVKYAWILGILDA